MQLGTNRQNADDLMKGGKKENALEIGYLDVDDLQTC